MEVNDIVWFQAYKDREPVQGKITRIGTQVELQIGWRDDDDRVFYELESIGEKRNFVFTKTTAQWLSKTKQDWTTFIEREIEEDRIYWANKKKVQDQADMDNIPRSDYGINPSY
jgi:hypothetical protein